MQNECGLGLVSAMRVLKKLVTNNKIMHVPFGSRIILPMTQLHASHYGQRSHARVCAVAHNDRLEGAEMRDLNTCLSCKHKIKKTDLYFKQ